MLLDGIADDVTVGSRSLLLLSNSPFLVCDLEGGIDAVSVHIRLAEKSEAKMPRAANVFSDGWMEDSDLQSCV